MANKKKGKVTGMLSPENYIRNKARTLPVFECRINEDWEFSRIAYISVARQHTNGNITSCFYLVDLMCLGIKDTTYMFNTPIPGYKEQIEQIGQYNPLVPVDYVLPHNIIHAALEYASDYGLNPHKDFTLVTSFMLEEDTDDIELIEIECGLKGRPTYMPGPYEDKVKVKKIIDQLERTAGPGNYSFVYKKD